MAEIDEMLNRWISNSIIRERLRKLIINEINKDFKNK
tara:strand:+ start:898 stop:1008 length:111 start_codon:yes stop_codon:yes gene_type:complete